MSVYRIITTPTSVEVGITAAAVVDFQFIQVTY